MLFYKLLTLAKCFNNNQNLIIMKKVLLLLGFILGSVLSYGQTDCSQEDDIFRYRAHLSLENVPLDFDENDFLTYITDLDNISNQDLATLTDHITEVFKTIPSLIPHESVDIHATIEIYSILTFLENSIEFHYCVLTDCSTNDGTYAHYAALSSGPVTNDFDKNDFINYITGLDNISNNDLAFLNTNITSVFKAFPYSQSPWLQGVVVIEANADIYFILESLNNSIEFHECTDDDIVLGVNDVQGNKHSIIYPNPITEDSVLKLNTDSNNVRIELINISGQIVYSEKTSGQSTIAMSSLPVGYGISFVKVYDLDNGSTETLKIVKVK